MAAPVRQPQGNIRCWPGLRCRSSEAKQFVNKEQQICEPSKSGTRAGSCGLFQSVTTWPVQATPGSPTRVRSVRVV